MAKSVLARQPDNTIQITITIPKEEVKKTYDAVVEKLTKNAEVPGFRKGKAPKKIVEEKVDKSHVYEDVIQEIIPQAYTEAIEETKVKPIVSPKIELLKAQEGEDWEFRATTCEFPNIDLNNYKEEVKKTVAVSKIWTPGSGEPKKEEEHEHESEDEKTQKIIEVLLRTVKVDLPSILIEDQLNRALANLINQIEKMRISLDQYLASINKTADQLREEYAARVSNELKIQFILDEIGKEEKLEAAEKEIDDFINASGDPELKKTLSSPEQKEYIERILSRRKVLEFLGKL